MLIDSAIIEVRSGRGGDGAVAFRREKYIPKGGPHGGDGGNGGSVILVAAPGVDTLLDFAGRHHWFADNGQPGAAKQCHGKVGQDLHVKLPPGTLVYDAETDELLVDLDEPGKQFIIAKGGRGGFGNEHFKSPTNQTPREATPGQPGEHRTLRLELKLIADIGLVGLPNAGKSTFLASVSKARPKIADYPFTTLEPNLGIAELGRDQAGAGMRLVIADIPGLIQGAHTGHGLGVQFLRHIERTRLLIHLIDIEPADDSDPIENYRVICNELSQYSQELATKPQIIAVNKMDLLATDDDRAAAVELIQQAIGRKTFAISAATGQGVRELLLAAWHMLKTHKRPEAAWSTAENAANG